MSIISFWIFIITDHHTKLKIGFPCKLRDLEISLPANLLARINTESKYLLKTYALRYP